MNAPAGIPSSAGRRLPGGGGPPSAAAGPPAWPADDGAAALLSTMLAVAVPLEIQRLRLWSVQQRHELVRDAAQMVAEHGDDLMYGGRHCKDAFAAVVRALAVGAYQPGGVSTGCGYRPGRPPEPDEAGVLGHWCVYPHPWCPATRGQAAPPCCVCDAAACTVTQARDGDCPDPAACPWCTNGCTPGCAHPARAGAAW